MSDADGHKWKEKYLRSLDELEHKEQQFAEAEELLRRSVGRLAHLGYGANRSLDRQLDQIREAVRGGRDPQGLERLVRETCDAGVQTLEQTQRMDAQVGPALAGLLARLPLTARRAKQAERLRGQLETALSLDRLRPLLGEVTILLEGQDGAVPPASPEGGATPSAPPSHPSPPQTQTQRPGLLSRLLGGRPPVPSSTGDAVPITTAVAAPELPSAPATARILERLLGRLQPGPLWREQLTGLQRQATGCRGEGEALRLLEESALLLAEILQAAEQAGPLEQAVVEALPAAGETLIHLLERLDIPPHLQERTGVIKDTLARPLTPPRMGLAVQSIADLLGDMRREAQSERQELEQFLEGVTSRVRVLFEHAAALGGNRHEAHAARSALQTSLHDQMLGMRHRMQGAQEVASLKLAIEEGLDAIEVRLSRYLKHEEGLAQTAEERIADLKGRLHDMQHEAFLLQQKLHEQHDLAMTDPLTGVPNRLAYDERLEIEYQRWRHQGTPLSLLVLDIDHFKRINDRFGHVAGDKALKALATRLQQGLREVDLVARYSGEEFVAILTDTPADQAYGIAEQLRGRVATAGFHYRQQPVAITVSCGVASFQGDDNPQEVFRRADEALYAAKQEGRNRTRRETLGAARSPVAPLEGRLVADD